MAKYTYQAGAHWPRSLIDLTDYKDADNTVGALIAEIKAAQEAGDFDTAQELITGNEETLKQYVFGSADINKYVEELRNLQIYSKAHKQQIFYGAEDEVDTYIEAEDVWIGNNTQEDGLTVGRGSAIPSDVREGATFSSLAGIEIEGTMPTIPGETIMLSPGDVYDIPAGYHDGNGQIKVSGTSASGIISEPQTMGTYTANQRNIILDVLDYAKIKFSINVPTIMKKTIKIDKKATLQYVSFDRLITNFVYVVGPKNTTATTTAFASGTRVDYSVEPTAYESSHWKIYNPTTGYKISQCPLQANNDEVKPKAPNIVGITWGIAGVNVDVYAF